MSKILIFNFDGTDNEPQDADQSIKKGKIEDDSITNILKFHILCGGDLKEQNTPLANGTRILYYHGVGTYGHFFQRKFNAALSPNRGDVKHILNNALKDFQKYYVDEGGFEKILITGFSRGGAIARRFASLINDRVADNAIIEGIFDTVASIGAPNLSKRDRPSSDVVFENGHTLPSNVEKALHMVSLDDKRRAFQPTLMNQEDRVLEVWFAGAHSDVGGGYHYDGLSDNVLQFFLSWIEDLTLDIELLNPRKIDYTSLVDEGEQVVITQEDMIIEGSHLGYNHQQDRAFLIKQLTLTDRACVVIKQDRVTNELPLVHWSVADKVFEDNDYKPQSLKTSHKILYADDSTKAFSGYSEHKYPLSRNLEALPETGKQTKVHAYIKYNRTGVVVEKGKTYSIKRIGNHTWHDGGIRDLDGNGWNLDNQQLGLKEPLIRVMQPLRRVPDADWYGLCATVGQNDEHARFIGNEGEFKAPKAGELCLFANDLDGRYGNNRGKLMVEIKLKP